MQRGPRPRHIPIDQYFWAIVQPNLSSDACWEWPGSRHNGQWPYGFFTLDGEQIPAHRAAWIITYGPIPDGIFILHRCDNPPCVRPSHLFAGTPLANMRDMIAKGRNKPIQRAMKNGRWAVRYDACIACGTTIVQHHGKGRCIDCHSLLRHGAPRALLQSQPGYRWSRHYDACITCKQIDSPHTSRGQCARCSQHLTFHNGRWARSHQKCVVCLLTAYPHKAKGVCKNCYQLALRAKALKP